MLQQQLQQQQHQHDSEQMTAQDNHHRIMDYIGSLDKETLGALLMLLKTVENNGQGFLYTYMGMLSARLRFEFNVCEGCGKDHLQELIGEPTQVPPTSRFQQLDLFTEED